MKMPSTFSTGDPSYFVVATTFGNDSPTVLTISKELVTRCLSGLRFIDVGPQANSQIVASGIRAAAHSDIGSCSFFSESEITQQF
jgi:hypothetical protein